MSIIPILKKAKKILFKKEIPIKKENLLDLFGTASPRLRFSGEIWLDYGKRTETDSK